VAFYSRPGRGSAAALLTAAWLLLAPAFAGVAHGADAPSAQARAREYFEAGIRAYKDGHYQLAADAFEAGYSLVRRPSFMLNLAQAYRKLGDDARALTYYRQLLAAPDLDEPTRRAVTDVIATIEREQAAAAVNTTPPTTTPAPVVGAPVAVADDPQLARAAPPPRRRWNRDVAGGLLVGGGAAVAVVGAGLIIRGSLLLADSGHDLGAYEAARGAPALNIGATVLLAGGGALIVAGILRYALVARRAAH
jgi:tetratricopeptide (TPR) repeat protein